MKKLKHLNKRLKNKVLEDRKKQLLNISETNMEKDLNIWDVYDFVREIFRKENPEEADEIGESKLEEYLYERFEFGNFYNFVEFMTKLMDFVPILESPLTKEYHHCLGIQHENGLFEAILKKEV